MTTEFPWPATSGGVVRTLSQLQVLSALDEVSEVVVMSLAEHCVPEEDRLALSRVLRKATVLTPAFHPIHLFDHPRFLPRVVWQWTQGLPYLAAKWGSRGVWRALRQCTHQRPIDVVYVDHLGMARYLPFLRRHFPRARIVLGQHNVESDFFSQLAEDSTGVRKAMAVREYRRAAAFEADVLRNVDAVVAISDDDADTFERMSARRAVVVPMVVEVGDVPSRVWQAPDFCYVGNLRWKPNVQGLDWFCEQVWPLVLARLPNATLRIAGVGLAKGSRSPWQGRGIDTIGFVEDLETLYQRSLAMVAPIRGGSGVRLKLLEGFRAGLPLVTTPDGAKGLALQHQRELLIAQRPEEFAECMVQLATQPQLRTGLVAQAYKMLQTHHSMDAATEQMRRVLHG